MADCCCYVRAQVVDYKRQCCTLRAGVCTCTFTSHAGHDVTTHIQASAAPTQACLCAGVTPARHEQSGVRAMGTS
jgi:hypothetical protein